MTNDIVPASNNSIAAMQSSGVAAALCPDPGTNEDFELARGDIRESIKSACELYGKLHDISLASQDVEHFKAAALLIRTRNEAALHPANLRKTMKPETIEPVSKQGPTNINQAILVTDNERMDQLHQALAARKRAEPERGSA